MVSRISPPPPLGFQPFRHGEGLPIGIPLDIFPPRPPGYLEIGGPKMGRDYTDPHFREELRASLGALKSAFT